MYMSRKWEMGSYLTSSVLLRRPLSCRAFNALIDDSSSALARLVRQLDKCASTHFSVLVFTNGTLTSCPARFMAAAAAAARASICGVAF